jgi:hypothetical protein
MPQITPVEYQPIGGQPPAAPPAAPPPAPGRRYDPKVSSRNRVILLTISAAACSVVWGLVCLFFPPIQPVSVLIVGGLALVVWTAFSILTHQDEAFFLRLTGTGDLFTLLWMLLTSGLLLLQFFPIPSGLFAIWGLWLISLTLPVWVIEMEPGEVFYHRPIHHRPYRYELIGLGIEHATPGDIGNGTTNGDARLPGFVRPFVVGSSVQQQAAHIALNIDFIWVRPIDELRLLWKLEKRIVIEGEIRDIVTRDNSNFSLWVKAAANHDPRKITAPPILLRLPHINSPAELEAILSKSLTDAFEKAARLYFINKYSAEARGQDGVLGFRSRLAGVAKLLDEVSKGRATPPEGDELYNIFKGMKEGLGLSILESSLNSTPIITPEVRGAAEHAAARYDAARAELATTDEIIERAMRGSVDDQLLLYTRLIERGHQLRYAPPAAQLPTSEDPLIQKLRQMNPGDAQRLWSVLVQAFPDLSTRPAVS